MQGICVHFKKQINVFWKFIKIPKEWLVSTKNVQEVRYQDFAFYELWEHRDEISCKHALAIGTKVSTKHPVDIKALAEQNRKKLLHTDLLGIRTVIGNTDIDIFDGTILGKRQNSSAGCWWLTLATHPTHPGRRRGIKHLEEPQKIC